MPSGNLAVSTAQRPLPSTTNPLESHFCQKSSRLMYTKPCALSPLPASASACALITASVGLRRTKLQLLQPMAGLSDRPLVAATAGGAAGTTSPSPPSAAAATPVRSLRRMSVHLQVVEIGSAARPGRGDPDGVAAGI